MKNFKLVLIALFAILFVSCEKETKEKEETPSFEMQFTGKVTTVSSEDVKFSAENAQFDITFNTDKSTVDIVMNEMIFTDKMPAQTMSMNSVPYTYIDGVVRIGAAAIVPVSGGRPYEKFIITRLESNIKDGSISLEFSCIGYAVVYTATSKDALPTLPSTKVDMQTYSGTLDMISPRGAITSTKDIVFKTSTSDIISRMDMTMNGIKFSPMMPDLAMDLKWIVLTKDGDTTTFSGALFTPFVYGESYPSYSFVNVKGSIKGDVLTTEMMINGFTVKYTGTVK